MSFLKNLFVTKKESNALPEQRSVESIDEKVRREDRARQAEARVSKASYTKKADQPKDLTQSYG